MAVDRDRLEIERLMNLIRGFGWELEKQEFTDADIIITVKRARVTEIPEAGAGPG